MERLDAACHAMATRFELVLHGPDRIRLRAAADQACAEIHRLHAQLSLYLPTSEISSINAHAGERAVQVEPGLFDLLKLCQRLHNETRGAFDITIGPLLRCWGFMAGSGALPSEEAVDEARARVGMRHVVLDDSRRTIRFLRPGMMLDLGSIGKGYALDAAAEALIEAGVERALIHGGTSTVYALGAPPEADAWKVAIDSPPQDKPESSAVGAPAGSGARPLAVVSLQNEALSVSAPHGKCFHVSGKTYGHVIDPRTGAPGQCALLAAVVLPCATETDALSTALLLAGRSGMDEVRELRPGMRTLLVEGSESENGLTSTGFGIE